jgi:hypothetical protein
MLHHKPPQESIVNVDLVIDQIRRLDEMLTKNGLPYCAVGGTLLGAVRHQGFIPWDDDFDILMSISDIQIMRENKYLEHLGYEVVPYWGESPFGKPLGCSVKKDGICSDIFPYRNAGTYIETILGPFENRYTFPFKRVKFEVFSILVPNDPIHYLNKTIPGWDKEWKVRRQPHTPAVKVENVVWSIPPLTEQLFSG